MVLLASPLFAQDESGVAIAVVSGHKSPDLGSGRQQCGEQQHERAGCL